MKTKLISFAIVALLSASKLCFAQEKKSQIYFLADTINISKENHLLEMGTEGNVLSYFSFYCKCLPPYNYNLSFSFRNDQQRNEIVKTKPDHAYISWKQLLELVTKAGKDYDKNYDFFITEVLKDSYRTNKVNMVKYKEPLIDIQKIKEH